MARPILDDVARKAGVSRTTVSRFFNEPQKIKHVTRERIQAAIDTIDYVPNAAARVLASNRSRLIGAVIPTLDNALFSRELKDTEKTLNDAGYGLVVGSFDYQREREYEMIQSMLSRNVDGVLLVGQERDPAIYRLLDKQGVAYVTTWTIDRKSRHPQVGADVFAAAYDLTKILLDMGHKDFGLIDFPLEGNDRVKARFDGIRAALSATGASLPDAAVLRAKVEYTEGKRALEELMTLPKRPTAVMCGGDVFAIGALLGAPRIGIDVPGDVSVTGFDNHPLSELVQPRLTTIRLPVHETGIRAAEVLLSTIQGKTTAIVSEFPYHIELRASTRRIDQSVPREAWASIGPDFRPSSGGPD